VEDKGRKKGARQSDRVATVESGSKREKQRDSYQEKEGRRQILSTSVSRRNCQGSGGRQRGSVPKKNPRFEETQSWDTGKEKGGELKRNEAHLYLLVIDSSKGKAATQVKHVKKNGE